MDATSAQSYSAIKFTTEAVTGLITRWYPYRVWFTIMCSGTSDPTQYYYICYECFAEI